MINHIWQSTIFAAVVGVFALAFRRNRAGVRYCLWMAASLKFLLPFSPLIALGGRLHPIAADPVAIAAERLVAPFPASIPPTHSWLPALWFCGFLTVMFLRLRAWLQFRAAVRAGKPMGPAVFGLFRPGVLLPPGIADRLTPPELDAILAHERCHIRRRDNLLAALHMVVEAVYWFHPLVWWIGARLVVERERACDEAVLREGHPPRAYADAILSVCKLYLEPPLACMSDVTGGDIGKRIEAIMKNQEKRRLHIAKKFALAVAGVCALAVPLAMGMTSQDAGPSIQVSSSSANLQVPLFKLSGGVDIIARVVPMDHGKAGPPAAELRDRTQASKSDYRAKFELAPGMYKCQLLVRENSSSRMGTYEIAFEVQ